MDQEQFSQLPAAPYPAPPPFWKHFTTENIASVRDANSDEDVPFELNFLRPPPPPGQDAEQYTTFSVPWKLDPTPALPPPEILLFDHTSATFNHAKALKQLTTSLLLNFLELITVLSNDPIKYEEKMQDIEKHMLNIHFVVNLYRPHQAREGVKEMLQDQIDNGMRDIAKCDEVKARVEAFLKDVEQQNTKTEVSQKAEFEDPQTADVRQLWKVIHDLKDD